MWVIVNAAPKTGSTWVMQLAKSAKCWEPIPSELQNQKWASVSIDNPLVKDSALMLGKADVKYLTKQHWARENRELLLLDGVKLINSIRDIRDTLVSRYYHDVRLNGVQDSISTYLKGSAKKLVANFCVYQKYWIDAAVASPASYHICSYEYLSDNCEQATRELFNFCEVDVSDSELRRNIDSTRFEKKKTGEGRFFRKGKVHAFADDLSKEDLNLVMGLAEIHGLREIKNKIANYSPVLKPYLKMTDVGL